MRLADATPRVVVQGGTGRVGRAHLARMAAYGTCVVAAVTPGRGGERAEGIPVFDTVRAAVSGTGADTSVCFLPPAVAADGIVEAAEAGIGLVVCPTEGIHVHDAMAALEVARRNGTRVVGPNTAGLLVPGRLSLGFLPGSIATPGPCAVVSRSGTLSYEVVLGLTRRGVGQSLWLGVGGDRVKGTTFSDALGWLADDGRTRAVVLLGEIGGAEEEAAAGPIAELGLPVVALIAGRRAPVDVPMGHAGALVQGSSGTHAAKVAALEAAGARMVASPTQAADAVADLLGIPGVRARPRA